MQSRYTGIQPKFAAVVNPQQDINTPAHGAPIVIPLDDANKGDDAGQTKAITKSELPAILREAEKIRIEQDVPVIHPEPAHDPEQANDAGMEVDEPQQQEPAQAQVEAPVQAEAQNGPAEPEKSKIESI
jgi:hypothetical protein